MQVSPSQNTQKSDSNFLNNLYQMGRQETKLESDIQGFNKMVQLYNQKFNHQLESYALTQGVKRFEAELVLSEQKYRILEIEKDLYQQESNKYKQKVRQLYQLIQEQRIYKKQLIEQYDKSQSDLREKLNKMQGIHLKQISQVKQNGKQKQDLLEAQYVSAIQQLKKQEEKNKKLTTDYEQATKSLNKYKQKYTGIKILIQENFKSIIQQNEQGQQGQQGQEGQQGLDEQEILAMVQKKYQGMRIQTKDVCDLARIEEGTNQYINSRLELRIKAIFENYKAKINNKQKNLQNIEITLNNLLKIQDQFYESNYGSSLLGIIQKKFGEFRGKIKEYQQKQQQRKNQKCQLCQMKGQKIKELYEKGKKYLEQNKKFKDEIEKLTVIVEKLQKDKANWEKEENNFKQKQKQFQQISHEFQQSYKNQKNKVSLISQQLQSLSKEKQGQMESLRNKLKTLQSQKKKSQSIRKQLQARIDEVINQNKKISERQTKNKELNANIEKQSQNKIKKLEQQVQKQKKKTSEFQAYRMNYYNLQENNRNITKMIDETRNNLAIKNNQLRQVENQLNDLANMIRKQRNEQPINGQNYKQSIRSLQILLRDTQQKNGSLFKIPSLSDEFDSNMKWVQNLIKIQCQYGHEFKTRFIGKIEENTNNFTTLLNINSISPNILLIIQTSKEAIFCIFVTKFTTTIKDRDPVTLFSPGKKLKYPTEKPKSISIRPSLINTQGTVQFGKKQVLILKNLQMKIEIQPTGYFGKIDTQAVFGSQVGQQLKVKKMQIYSIVF